MNDICQAIQNQQYVSFSYDGYGRVVIPVCHGTTTAGNDALRAYQTEGGSKEGKVPGWKLFKTEDINNLQILDKTFSTPPDGYKPGDSAMGVIHCQL